MKTNMKKMICLLLGLCLLLAASGALAQERVVPVCGNAEHYKGDGLDHSRPQSCWVTGHFSCDGQDHAKAECGWWGHFNCDPKPHGPAACGVEGHYVCDGKKHGPAPCGIEGHCLSDGLHHNASPCGFEGHYACVKGLGKHKRISQFCDDNHYYCQFDAEPTHYCDPQNGGCGKTYLCSKSGSHTECVSCGLLWCDYSLGGHSTPCGKVEHRPCAYALRGAEFDKFRKKDHEQCKYCLDYKCDNWGYHGAGKCVKICKACGEGKVENKSHRHACGEHYGCVKDELIHEYCEEHELYMCSEEHAEFEETCQAYQKELKKQKK